MGAALEVEAETDLLVGQPRRNLLGVALRHEARDGEGQAQQASQ
jgi:hypothetical protein